MKKGYFVTTPNPDEIHVRTGLLNSLFVIEDDKKTGKIPYIISLFNGQNTIEEILNLVGEEMKEDVLQLIEVLNQQGMLIDGDIFKDLGKLSSYEKKLYEPILSFFSLLSRSSELENHKNSLVKTIFGKLKKTKVMMIGSRMIGFQIAIQLAQLGVGKLSIADNDKVSESDIPFITFLESEEFGLLRSEVAVSRIKKINSNLQTSTIDENEITKFVGNYDIVIVAKDRLTPHLYEIINKEVIRHENIWTKATMDGIIGIVGPTVVPHETACYNCYELQLKSNLKTYNHYLQDKVYIGSHPELYSETIGLPSYANIIAGFLVSDIPYILLESGNTFGRELTINFPIMKIEEKAILKLPRCPVCQRKR